MVSYIQRCNFIIENTSFPACQLICTYMYICLFTVELIIFEDFIFIATFYIGYEKVVPF